MTPQLRNLLILLGAIAIVLIVAILLFGGKSPFMRFMSIFLEEEGVNRGYATFWNANSVTVITGESIKVSDVDVNERGVFSRPYQSSKRWYETDPEQGEYFLLLSGYEMEQMNLSDFPIYNEPIRTAQRSINGIDFNLLVYDHNIVTP